MEAVGDVTETDTRLLTEMRDELASIRKRLDALESFADKAAGAITLAKFAISVLGIGGMAAIIAVLARTAP